MSSEVEIGVWVEGVQKWVTGVSRRTTCHDVIKALLRSQNLPAQEPEINNYIIVERWRKVERPLDHEQRILKVWKTWGEAIQEVRFTLRRVRADGERFDSEAESRTERSRRRQRWKASHKEGKDVEKVSKRSTKEEPTLSDTMDRLMRLVLAQGETIQAQLRRLQERDQQIETYEQQMHLLRVKSIGSDYLLHSYLKDPSQEPHLTNVGTNATPKDDLTCEETSNDSGVVTEEVCDPSPQEIGKSNDAAILDEVAEEVEEVRLRVSALESLETILTNLIEQELYLSNLENSLIGIQNAEVDQITDELTHASKVHSQTVADVRQNESYLRELDKILFHRRSSLESLSEEEVKLDEEILGLEAHLEYIMHLPPSAFNLLHEFSSEGYEETPEKSSNNTKNFDKNPRSSSTTNESAQGIKPKPKEPSKANPKPEPVKATAPQGQVPGSSTEEPPPLPSSSPPPLIESDPEQLVLEGPLQMDANSSGDTNSQSNSTPSSSSSTASCSTVSSTNSNNNEILKTRTCPKKCIDPSKDNDSTDSNSDTGLSSLHSSSDEGVLYTLDTLV